MTTMTRRQMNTAATRAALLKAACGSFVTRGYMLTSVEDITATALLSKGAFYRHFADKQGVFVELFSERLREAAAVIEQAAVALASTTSGQGPALAAACAYEFAARSLTDEVHRELLRQAPEVLRERAYTEMEDELVLPALQRLLNALAARGELIDTVTIDTTARLLLRLLCAANTIIANADDREAMLAECTATMMAFFSGITRAQH